MKYHRNTILRKVIFRYINDQEQTVIVDKLFKIKNWKSKNCYHVLIKNFDITRFRDEPLIWQDIWLYNYIKYDVTIRPGKRRLIEKYEKQAFVFDDEAFWRQKDEINAKKSLL